MEIVQEYLHNFQQFLSVPLFKLGTKTVTISSVLYVILAVILLVYLTGKIKNWLIHKAFARSTVDIGVRTAIGSILRYLIVTIGFVIILQTAGIDLSGLAVLAGAVGIGIGFGLQNISSNFISGIIILLERPIKVGDRIQVEDIDGDVISISLRATTVVTNDNIAVIIPNSEFISSQVINWSYTNRDVRFHVPVGVSYGSDPELVRSTLMQVASEHPGVLKNPTPDVLFTEFADSSLNFDLRVWTREYTPKPGALRSELNYLIIRAFREKGIEIPFPQRDVYLKSVPSGFRTPLSEKNGSANQELSGSE
jgi:small-conductance mechanosensitive channel